MSTALAPGVAVSLWSSGTQRESSAFGVTKVPPAQPMPMPMPMLKEKLSPEGPGTDKASLTVMSTPQSGLTPHSDEASKFAPSALLEFVPRPSLPLLITALPSCMRPMFVLAKACTTLVMSATRSLITPVPWTMPPMKYSAPVTIQSGRQNDWMLSSWNGVGMPKKPVLRKQVKKRFLAVLKRLCALVRSLKVSLIAAKAPQSVPSTDQKPTPVSVQTDPMSYLGKEGKWPPRKSTMELLKLANTSETEPISGPAAPYTFPAQAKAALPSGPTSPWTSEIQVVSCCCAAPFARERASLRPALTTRLHSLMELHCVLLTYCMYALTSPGMAAVISSRHSETLDAMSHDLATSHVLGVSQDLATLHDWATFLKLHFRPDHRRRRPYLQTLVAALPHKATLCTCRQPQMAPLVTWS
mmetsp:Transcript_51451/g.149472  ORF Transcript_51451/g.149472 Transcript_51451/m.149472 type:complete len:413 (-) Transcript_51451:96-1334(-)